LYRSSIANNCSYEYLRLMWYFLRNSNVKEVTSNEVTALLEKCLN